MNARERRQARRARIDVPARYRMIGSLLVDDVRDLSETGLLLSCREPLPLGTLVELSLPEGRAGVLVLEGKVVRVMWGGRDKGAPVAPGMAIAFETMSTTSRARLVRLIERTPAESA